VPALRGVELTALRERALNAKLERIECEILRSQGESLWRSEACPGATGYGAVWRQREATAPGGSGSTGQTRAEAADMGTDMAIRSNRIAALLIMLGTAVVVGKSVPIHAEDQMISLNPQTLKWIAIPDMPPCATAAILRGNPRWGAAWVLLRLASGCQVPW